MTSPDVILKHLEDMLEDRRKKHEEQDFCDGCGKTNTRLTHGLCDECRKEYRKEWK